MSERNWGKTRQIPQGLELPRVQGRWSGLCRWALLALSLTLGPSAGAETAPGSTSPAGQILFNQHCASCHSGFLGSRAPSKQVLAKFPAASIIHALTVGVMRTQGYALDGEQRRAIAEHITGKRYKKDLLNESQGACKERPPMADPALGAQWAGWGNGAGNHSFQSAKAAGLTPANVKNLKLRWAFGFPDAYSAWSQPVLASGRLFVGSQAGVAYALDSASGCTYWQFKADAGIRGAASIVSFDSQTQARLGARYGVLFGDLSANVYALNAETGQLLWKLKLDEHPKARVTGPPVLFEGRYLVPMSSWSTVGDPEEGCCTFRGSLSAVDVASGRLLWKTYTIPEQAQRMSTVTRFGEAMFGPSGAAIWAPPLVDAKRRLVYVGTGNSYTGATLHSDALLAFDIDSGHLRWSRQLTPHDVWVPACQRTDTSRCEHPSGPNFDIASPPMLVTVTEQDRARDIIVVGQKSGLAYALDPERQGAIMWQYRAGEGGTAGGIIWGSAAHESRVFFPLSDMTSAEPGGLHAVDALTGRRLWRAPPRPLLCGSNRYGCNAAQPVGVAVVPGIVFAGAIDGGIRAYASDDGHVLWEFDTNREFETVNQVPATGGSLVGTGPTVADGMLFVNSGYGTNGGRAGNVLLAFSIR